MSNSSANALMVQNDLMKRGLISPNDFMKYKQNVTDGWKNFSTAIKGWDTHYKGAMERMQTDKASGMEIYMNEQIESFGNLQNMQGYVNPNTGVMSLVHPGEDGSIPTDPSQHMNLNTINARMNQKDDRVDLTANVSQETEKLAKVIEVEIASARGAYNSYEDFRNIKDAEGNSTFDKFLTDIANTQTALPSQVASILSDNVGGYTYTQDEDEAAADPTKILLKPDGMGRMVPDFETENGKQQMDAAKEAVKRKAESQLDMIHKYDKGHQKTYAPQESGITRGVKDREKRYTNHYNNINDLITGNEQSATKAANSLVTRLNKEMRGVKDYVPVEKIERVDSNKDGKVDQYIIHKKGEEPFIIEGTVNDVELTSDEIAESIFDQATGGELTYEEVSAGQTMGERGEGGVSSEKVKVAKIEKGYDKQNKIVVGGEEIALTSAVDDVGDLYGDITDQVSEYDVILKEVFNMSATPGIKEAFAEEDISMTNEGDVITITIGDISYKYPNDAPGYTEGDGADDKKWDKPGDVWKFVDTVIDEAIKAKTDKSRKKDESSNDESSNEGDDILDGE